jgi:hypothetical protein
MLPQSAHNMDCPDSIGFLDVFETFIAICPGGSNQWSVTLEVLRDDHPRCSGKCGFKKPLSKLHGTLCDEAVEFRFEDLSLDGCFWTSRSGEIRF